MYVTCKGSFPTYIGINVFYLQVTVPTYRLMYLPVCECFPGQNGALRDAASAVHPRRVVLPYAVPVHRERLVDEVIR